MHILLGAMGSKHVGRIIQIRALKQINSTLLRAKDKLPLISSATSSKNELGDLHHLASWSRPIQRSPSFPAIRNDGRQD